MGGGRAAPSGGERWHFKLTEGVTGTGDKPGDSGKQKKTRGGCGTRAASEAKLTPGGKTVQKRDELYLDQNSKSKNEKQIQAPRQVFRRLHGVASKTFLSLTELRLNQRGWVHHNPTT